jgi:multicomponent Na+:H+ antiporter subunit E
MHNRTTMRGNADNADTTARSRGKAPKLGVIAIFAALWWLISGGEVASWLYGVPAVALAIYVSTHSGTWPDTRVRPLRLLRLSAQFLWSSVRAGIDVARRVLGRELRIRPAVVSYDWRLPEGGLRTLMIAIINLQPGTLCVFSDGAHVQVHVLDEELPLIEWLTRLEEQVADLLGHKLRTATEREA